MKNKKTEKTKSRYIHGFGVKGTSKKKFLDYINSTDKFMFPREIAVACGFTEVAAYIALPKLAAEGLVNVTRSGRYWLYSRKNEKK